jgi:hypothetical protein
MKSAMWAIYAPSRMLVGFARVDENGDVGSLT